MFPWVETTIGAGDNGKAQPAGFNAASTGEGSTSMAFYNVQNGDAPYFKHLADTYALSDNFHQSVMGGTGANHIMFGFGDAIWYSDGKGNAATPPTNQIENPDPQPGTNNYYDQDGYSGGSYTRLRRSEPAWRAGGCELLASSAPTSEAELRCGPLLPAEQLQPGLSREWRATAAERFALHDSADVGAPHW